MSAPVSITLDTAPLQDAMRKYMVLKRKSGPDVVNRAMRFWLPFASAKVKAVTPGAGAIRTELTGAATRHSSGANKRLDALRNSKAAAIIAARLKKKGWIGYDKSEKGTAAKAAARDFYDQVSKLVNARARSTGYLASGFIPAFRKFRVPNRGIKADKSSGHSSGTPALPSQGEYAHAHAVNAREGTMKVAPHAFQSSIPEVRAQFVKWINEDMVKRDGRKAGFKVS